MKRHVAFDSPKCRFRRTIVVLVDGDKAHVGSVICGGGDRFSRKKGAELAQEYAERAAKGEEILGHCYTFDIKKYGSVRKLLADELHFFDGVQAKTFTALHDYQMNKSWGRIIDTCHREMRRQLKLVNDIATEGIPQAHRLCGVAVVTFLQSLRDVPAKILLQQIYNDAAATPHKATGLVDTTQEMSTFLANFPVDKSKLV